MMGSLSTFTFFIGVRILRGSGNLSVDFMDDLHVRLLATSLKKLRKNLFVIFYEKWPKICSLRHGVLLLWKFLQDCWNNIVKSWIINSLILSKLLEQESRSGRWLENTFVRFKFRKFIRGGLFSNTPLQSKCNRDKQTLMICENSVEETNLIAHRNFIFHQHIQFLTLSESLALSNLLRSSKGKFPISLNGKMFLSKHFFIQKFHPFYILSITLAKTLSPPSPRQLYL